MPSETPTRIWMIPSVASTGLTRSRTDVVQLSRLTATNLIAALGMAFVAPMVLHMVTGASIGPRALPMFYAPLLAVLVLRLPIAIAVTAVAPLLNHAVTGLPPAPLLPSLVLNIGLFVLLVRLLRLQPWMLVAPVAYVASLAGTNAVAQLLGDGPQRGFLDTLQTGWPGVLALAILGLVLDRWLR